MKRAILTLALCLPPLLPLVAGAQQPVKLKFAVFSPDTERLYNTVKKPWVEAVNKAAGGAIQIELFPNGALGRAPQQQARRAGQSRKVWRLERRLPREVAPGSAPSPPDRARHPEGGRSRSRR